MIRRIKLSYRLRVRVRCNSVNKKNRKYYLKKIFKNLPCQSVARAYLTPTHYNSITKYPNPVDH